jgi:hypothetical protein
VGSADGMGLARLARIVVRLFERKDLSSCIAIPECWLPHRHRLCWL